MTAAVAITDLNHRFGPLHALKDIALTVEAGEYIALLGPSGCGKTTLLSVLGGFILPNEGRVEIGGHDVTRTAPARRPTTTVFQDYALFPHMSLRENVGFGLRMSGTARRTRNNRAEEMLDLVGLAHVAAKRPHALSGGQRQRVALARALAVNPQVLLLDEPLGALDLKLRRAMQDELKAIQRKIGTTFIHVTHDQEEAMAIADRIVVMKAGRIEDVGPPARLYQRPATLFTADFLGTTNQIPAEGQDRQIDTPLGPLPLIPPRPGPLTAVIRPEALRLDATALPLGAAMITDTTFFGAHQRVQLSPQSAPELTLTAHLPPSATLQPGTRTALSVAPEDVSLFPAD